MRYNNSASWSSRGYTLVEVGIAVFVLALTVASSLVVMRTGFAMIESARDNTLASQILQSEMENLRLQSWQQLESLQEGPFKMDSSFQGSSAARFTTDLSLDDPNPDLREITLAVSWTSFRGEVITRSYSSYFSRNGLNDYYYRSFH